MAEQDTLYKLMILYMLKRVNFPMSMSQLWQYFRGKDCLTEEGLGRTLASLTESNLVLEEEVNGVPRFEMTKQGDEALYYFKNDIPDEIVSEMEAFISANKFQVKKESGVQADYYKSPDEDYYVHLKVREGKTILFELKLSVPTEDQAKVLSRHLEKNAQEIYAYVMKKIV